MFGLGKGDKGESYIFDLENDIVDSEKCQELLNLIISKMQRIKELLRKGGKKDDFGQLGVILHGYNALRMVINRTRAQQEKER